MRKNPTNAEIVLTKFEGPSREELPNPQRTPEVITIHAVAEPTRKRRGEAAEAAFLARATHLGFSVCLPWGDSERYDSVVDLGHGFLRVQVKSATRYLETRYRVKTTGASGTVYTPAEIDFFVAYIVPEDIWYIIPIQAIGHRKGARFYPHARHQSHGHFEKYREAWCLLACNRRARGWKDIPSVCRCKDLPLRCTVCPNHNALSSK
jgi:PD-(D/E)XK endonuclease